jgi:AcrR family transcriptional regulator
MDAFAAARAAFMAGERLDMQALAAQLGVNRATLYRWVGSKELLLGEIISSLAETTMVNARRDVAGTGAGHVAGVVQRGLEQMHTFPPMRAFIERDPEYALRVLTSRESVVQLGSVARMRDLLADEVAAGNLHTKADLEDLAYVIIRIGESFLYSDLIIGREPEVAKAGLMVRLLLGEHS